MTGVTNFKSTMLASSLKANSSLFYPTLSRYGTESGPIRYCENSSQGIFRIQRQLTLRRTRQVWKLKGLRKTSSTKCFWKNLSSQLTPNEQPENCSRRTRTVLFAISSSMEYTTMSRNKTSAPYHAWMDVSSPAAKPQCFFCWMPTEVVGKSRLKRKIETRRFLYLTT